MIAIWTVSRIGPIASGMTARFGGKSRLTKFAMSGSPSTRAPSVMPAPRQAQTSTTRMITARKSVCQDGRGSGSARGLFRIEAGISRDLGGRAGSRDGEAVVANGLLRGRGSVDPVERGVVEIGRAALEDDHATGDADDAVGVGARELDV